MNDDYKGDKSKDFFEDVMQLAAQYGYKILEVKVKENGKSNP